MQEGIYNTIKGGINTIQGHEKEIFQIFYDTDFGRKLWYVFECSEQLYWYCKVFFKVV